MFTLVACAFEIEDCVAAVDGVRGLYHGLRFTKRGECQARRGGRLGIYYIRSRGSSGSTYWIWSTLGMLDG